MVQKETKSALYTIEVAAEAQSTPKQRKTIYFAPKKSFTEQILRIQWLYKTFLTTPMQSIIIKNIIDYLDKEFELVAKKIKLNNNANLFNTFFYSTRSLIL